MDNIQQVINYTVVLLLIIVFIALIEEVSKPEIAKPVSEKVFEV